MRGVILYGPPASGKDTVTRALTQLDPIYVQFPRIKVGGGRRDGYRIATDADIAELRARGDVIWENRRYGALYVVDRPTLAAYLAGCMPVLHLGQPKAIDAVRDSIPAEWLTVYLWCPREVAAERIAARQTGDVQDRIRAWHETPPITADLVIDTALTTPSEAAHHVLQRSTKRRA